MQGYSKINRAVIASLQPKKGHVFSKVEAYVWLTQKVWFGDSVSSKGESKGQLFASCRFLARAWGWNTAKVHRFLCKLDSQNVLKKCNANVTGSVTPQILITLIDIDLQHKENEKCNANVTPTVTKDKKKNFKENNTNVLSPEQDSGMDEKIDFVISYLNEQTKKNFKKKTTPTRRAISARLKEYDLEAVKKVIDSKVKEWTGTKQEKYLQPSTLFRASNFENYYNALSVTAKSPLENYLIKVSKIKGDGRLQYSNEATERKYQTFIKWLVMEHPQLTKMDIEPFCRTAWRKMRTNTKLHFLTLGNQTERQTLIKKAFKYCSFHEYYTTGFESLFDAMQARCLVEYKILNQMEGAA